MIETKNPYELTEQDYLHICDECRKNVIDGKDVGEGCPCYKDCLVECGQRKLLEYQKLAYENGNEPIFTLRNLCKQFGVK